MVYSSSHLWPHDISDTYNCDRSILNYSKIFEIFFKGSSHVAVTAILNSPEDLTIYDFQNMVLKVFTEGEMFILFYLFEFDSNKNRNCLQSADDKHSVSFDVLDRAHSDAEIRYTNTFTWQGKRFKLKPTQNINMDSELEIDYANLLETDAMKSASFVIVDQISVLHEYLDGPAKKPFLFPKSKYIVAIQHVNETNYRNLCENILEKMWSEYGIGNVIFIAPSERENIVSKWK